MSAISASVSTRVTEAASQTPAAMGYTVRLCLHCVIFLGALCVLTIPVWFFDERTLRDVSVWAKPLKFQVSLMIHFATLAVMIHFLTQATQRSLLLRAVIWASALAMLLEIVYIMLQASRGRASHFNIETSVEAQMYAIMGLGALTLVAGSFIVGFLVMRSKSPALGSGLKWGGAIGLMLGSVATLLVAGYMSSSSGHLVYESGSDAMALPILGWSTQTGDLRVAHFFATHTMQFLPLAGWLLDRGAVVNSRRVIVILAFLCATVIIATFLQALAGMPFLPFPFLSTNA